MIHDLFSKALLKCLNPWLGLHICLVVSNRFDPRMEWLNGHQLMQTSLFTDCCWIWTSSPKSAAWTSTNQHKPAQRNEHDVSFEILGILWNPKQFTRLVQLVNPHSATLTFQFVAFDPGWSFDWTQVGMMPSWRSFLRKWRVMRRLAFLLYLVWLNMEKCHIAHFHTKDYCLEVSNNWLNKHICCKHLPTSTNVGEGPASSRGEWTGQASGGLRLSAEQKALLRIVDWLWLVIYRNNIKKIKSLLFTLV